MLLKGYIIDIYFEKENEVIKSKKKNISREDVKKLVMDFFKKYPRPTYIEMHKFVTKELKKDWLTFHTVLYEIVGEFFGAGLARDFEGKFNQKQLDQGVKVEMEHTVCPLIAERIAKDHLVECPNYYTYLDKMEEECK